MFLTPAVDSLLLQAEVGADGIVSHVHNTTLTTTQSTQRPRRREYRLTPPPYSSNSLRDLLAILSSFCCCVGMCRGAFCSCCLRAAMVAAPCPYAALCFQLWRRASACVKRPGFPVVAQKAGTQRWLVSSRYTGKWHCCGCGEGIES